MLDEQNIVNRFWQYYNKCLKERKQKYLSICYLNCKFNSRHRIKKNGNVGFCENEEVKSKCKKAVFICNDYETAQGCKYYKCKNTEASVEDDFNKIIRNPGLCGQEYPKLAVLIWVLQGTDSDPEKNNSRLNRFMNALWYLFFCEWW